MPNPAQMHATLGDWFARDIVAFSLDQPASVHAAVDKLVASLDPQVQVLGLGEAMHGWDDILVLRNRVFQRLVEAYGFTAIAVESSFTRGRIVNEYVNGQPPADVWERGFSHQFGQVERNRALVEWMRQYNAERSHPVTLQFYGADAPIEMMYADSPRQALTFALDYLASVDSRDVDAYRRRCEELLGGDADWENQAAAFDASKSIGLSEAAKSLKVLTADLIKELRSREAELKIRTGEVRYLDALQHAKTAQRLLQYHAGMATESTTRIADLLGLRDLMMADNLIYAATRERSRGGGKVFAFAHNMHQQRGKATWQWGENKIEWWPAGTHLKAAIGYAVIGSAVGVSEAHGIAPPEPGTLEASLIANAAAGEARFVPTHNGKAALQTRAGSAKNTTYFPLTAQSLTDFDWLVVLDSTK